MHIKLPWKKIAVGAGVVAVVAVIVVALLPNPEPVDIDTVTRDTMRVTIETEGKTRVFDRYVISAPISGRLRRPTLEEGDTIGKGMPVAAIEPPPVDALQQQEMEERIAAAEAAVHQAAADQASAKAQLQQATRERDRLQQLVDAGAVARQDFERGSNAVDVAEQQQQAAAARVRAAQADLAGLRAGRAAYLGSGSSRMVTLTSPAAGEVLRVYEKSERLVPAGTPLVEVGDPNGLEIVIDVLSTDAVRIRAGDPVIVEGWGGDAPLHARVKYVEPSAFTKVSALGIEEQRVNVIAGFTQPAPELGDGFRVDANIVLWQGDDVLQAPSSALFRDGTGWAVFAVRDGTARKTTVTVGRRSAFEAQILSGLSKGDEVIVHPSDQISDGVRVERRSVAAE